MNKKKVFLRILCLIISLSLLVFQGGCKKSNSGSNSSSGADNGESTIISSTIDSQGSESFDSGISQASQASQASGNNTSTNTGSKTSSTANTNGVDPFGKYNPSITLSFGRESDDMVTDTLNKLGETIGDNRWTKLFSDTLGINIKYNWVAMGADGYATKLNLVITSGELPDICKVNSLQLNLLTAAGAIQDLTSIYNTYAADFTKKTLNIAGSDTLAAATVNGKLMGLPETVDPSVDSPMLWIRKDWLDNLGLAMPKNMTDLFNVIEKFTNNDPDKNGKNDTFGFTSYRGLWGTICGLEGFFAGYGSYPGLWLKKDGKLQYGAIAPEAKNALQALRDLYSNGYMPSDFAVYDSGACTQLLTSGKVGLEYGSHWNTIYPLNMSHSNDPKANWVAIPVLSALATPAKTISTQATAGWYVVKKGVKNPEALVKMYNMFIEKNWGATQEWGKYYLVGAVEGVWKFSPVKPSVTNQNLADFLALDQARKTNNFSKLTGSALGIQKRLEANDWGWEKIYGAGGSMGVIEYSQNNNLYVKNEFVTAPTPTMISRLTTLNDMASTAYMGIIVGANPINYFDAFVSDWKKAGGDQMTTEVNNWYKNK